MDECVALLAFEPRLVRPDAIGDRLVVEEVLPFSASGIDVHSGAFFVLRGFRVAPSASGSVPISPLSAFPVRALFRRIPSSRAFSIRSRSLRCERPSLKE